MKSTLVERMNQRVAALAFESLSQALGCVGLPTTTGVYRSASSDEFMYMDSRPWRGEAVYAFKHSFTRNYLFVFVGTKSLSIPDEDKPFRRGTFDLPDVES